MSTFRRLQHCVASAGRRPLTTVRAAVARGGSTGYQVEELRLREPRHDELLVRVVASGICHTDTVMRAFVGEKPQVLGHEGAGVVEKVGSSISSLRPGDHVVMSYASCGSCPSCAHGKPSYCDGHGSLNFAGTHPDGSTTLQTTSGQDVAGSFFQQSSFASHALAFERNVVKVDKTHPLESLAPLGCGVQTGAGAVVNSLRAQPGSTLAVFGCGAVGLSAIMAARLTGLSRIVAVDVTPSRLQVATRLGATHTLDGRSSGLKDLVKEATGGGAHYALDTTGQMAVLRAAFESLRAQGVCGMIAPGPGGSELHVDTMTLLHGRSVRGIIQGDSVSRTFIPTMIDWWVQGRFPLTDLITMYDGGLSDINKAVSDMKVGTVIKPVLRIGDVKW